MENNINLPIKIYPCKTSSVANIKQERKALHEEIEIKCFYEGSSSLLIGEKCVNVTAGDVVIINPYEFHATIDSEIDGHKGQYHLLMIPLDVFSLNVIDRLQLRSLLLVNNKSFDTLFSQNKRLYEIIMRMVEEYINKEPEYEIVINGLLLELFAQLLREGVTDREQMIMENNQLRYCRMVEPALRYIKDNYREKITVEQLAKVCNINKNYFCKKFKTVTHKTATEYIREYRFKVAEVMLRNTTEGIDVIAEYCGFESANYFCRLYKKVYGVSPGKNRLKK